MLVPRFSLRGYLLATIVAAIFFVVMSFAVRGSAWALGFAVGLGSLVVAFAAYGLVFAAAWYFVEVRLARDRVTPTSPFASDLPPEQVLPPTE